MARINQHIQIQGIVQGVGFRPTVYQYAQKHHLKGWVLNSANGVEIEISGEERDVYTFTQELRSSPPPMSKIDYFEANPIEFRNFESFEIIPSQDDASGFLPVSPDLAICPDCRRELFDPDNRRYRYPFINCTHCGPRFSIIKAIPYDRPNTSMASFQLCPECGSEYNNPSDRRFHAQPIACPICGPQVWFEAKGTTLATKEDAIQTAREWFKLGKILAVKGLGGFHLVCDAHNAESVERLRLQKQRSSKPFALMSMDLQTIKKYTQMDAMDEQWLNSPQAPIELLPMTAEGQKLAKIVAPDQTRLGFMMPYTPLHLLLMEQEADFPDVLVMTSGNLSEEPIAYENDEGRRRLSKIADGFLMHDRPIFMRTDDSVLTRADHQPYFFRRARGYAPDPIKIPFSALPIFGAGTELKNTFCLARENYAFVSHYIGDLENKETLDSYEQAVKHYESLFRIHPQVIACDLHPDYLATRYALCKSEGEGLPVVKVQHHHAHIAACLAENAWPGDDPVIGLAYDGTGYGTNATIWGGEILLASYKGFERVFHLSPVALPGGDAAVRKPARTALSYLLAAGIELDPVDSPPIKYLGSDEVAVVKNQINSGFNAPQTSSMGRLFDAIAAITGVCEQISYEAQAAMALESIADPDEKTVYPLILEGDLISPFELIRAVVHDQQNGIPPAKISAKFHNAIVAMSVEACERLRSQTGINQVAISGGVWQNQFLFKHVLPALQKAGFVTLYHSKLPPNDGCVSLGQVMIALAQS